MTLSGAWAAVKSLFTFSLADSLPVTAHFFAVPIIGVGTDSDPRRPKYSDLFDGPWVMVDGGDTCIVLTEISGPVFASIIQNKDVQVVPFSGLGAARGAIEAHQPQLAGQPIVVGIEEARIIF